MIIIVSAVDVTIKSCGNMDSICRDVSLNISQTKCVTCVCVYTIGSESWSVSCYITSLCNNCSSWYGKSS